MLLSDHFTFDELTATSHVALQEHNRIVAMEFTASLKLVAIMLEEIRLVAGPLYVHSGFRCAEINGLTPGSAAKSQHMIGQAADISAYGPCTKESVGRLFEQTRGVFRAKRASYGFGQLIREEKNGQHWVHVSLGAPFRPIDKCGEVMTSKDGQYEMIEKIV